MKYSSALRATGIFMLALLIPLISFAEEDPSDEIDRQRVFANSMKQEWDHERDQREAAKKAETEVRLNLQKQREQERLAQQFKGLSGTLSGLPEMPSFKGRFETRGNEEEESQ